MNNQYKVAFYMVSQFWGDPFWSWLEGGPVSDAREESTAEDFVDHLDSCITAILEGDPECYPEEEWEWLKDQEYECVDLKYDYSFIETLLEYAEYWDLSEELMDGLEKLLFLAKINRAA